MLYLNGNDKIGAVLTGYYLTLTNVVFEYFVIEKFYYRF